MMPNRALVAAIESADLDGVRGAMAAGADPNMDVSREFQPMIGTGRSLLHMAMVRRAIESPARKTRLLDIMRALIDAGAEPDRPSCAEMVFDDLSFFDTALNYAASSGDAEAVRLLLDCGADPAGLAFSGKPPAAQVYCTALHRAAENDDLEIARLLLAAGADANALGIGGITPLKIARGRGHTRIAEVLGTV